MNAVGDPPWAGRRLTKACAIATVAATMSVVSSTAHSENASPDDAAAARVTLPDMPKNVNVPPPRRTRGTTVHRVRRDALAAGLVIHGIGTIAASLVGLANGSCVDKKGDDTACETRGKLVYVPVFGPALAAGHLAICGGWICVGNLTLIQAVGGTLIVMGAIGHDVATEGPRARAPDVSIVPVISRQVRSFALNVAW